MLLHYSWGFHVAFNDTATVLVLFRFEYGVKASYAWDLFWFIYQFSSEGLTFFTEGHQIKGKQLNSTTVNPHLKSVSLLKEQRFNFLLIFSNPWLTVSCNSKTTSEFTSSNPQILSRKTSIMKPVTNKASGPRRAADDPEEESQNEWKDTEINWWWAQRSSPTITAQQWRID